MRRAECDLLPLQLPAPIGACMVEHLSLMDDTGRYVPSLTKRTQLTEHCICAVTEYVW